MSIEKKLLGTTSGGDAANVEDVFSTYLYEGTGSAQTITNGIDLAGEGGMVWIKVRETNGGAEDHVLFDTESPSPSNSFYFIKSLCTNSTAGYSEPYDSLTAWNNSGFAIGSNLQTGGNGYDYASWTFRKAPRFFDVVTWTGNATNRTIAHDLGCEVGMVIVKRTDASASWAVYHRGISNTKYLILEWTNSELTGSHWNSTTATDSVLHLGTDGDVNRVGAEYVAYLFAHDPDGEDDDGMIACGSYTGSSAAGNFVDLGWEPQYIMIKNASSAWQWLVFDTMRGITSGTGTADKYLEPNDSTVEGSQEFIEVNSRGFTLTVANAMTNTSGDTYIYMAIRAPMMVEPESGSEVFAVDIRTSSEGEGKYTSGFPVDMSIANNYDSVGNSFLGTRLTNSHLQTNATVTEGSSSGDYNWNYNDGLGIGEGGAFFGASRNNINWMFKRAKGFFDVVAYTGTSSVHTENHSLGVVPEMMIIKLRDDTSEWRVYHQAWGNTKGGKLDTAHDPATNSTFWNNTTPTDTVFTVGTATAVNDRDYGAGAGNHIAYLFATLAGVSKVGSYTGNGSSQNIACGFSAGARFVLIKRTDSTGDWYIWDTTRGIVTGNDPHLSLNTTAAEVTSDDSIDPQSAGFTVNQVTATNINVTSATYIFLAIA